MTDVVAAAGTLVCLLSATAILWPRWLLRRLGRLRITAKLRVAAFVIRTAIGVTFVLGAGATSSPALIRTIGVLFIVSGAIALVAPSSVAQAIVDGCVRRGPGAVRLGGAAGLVFGALLLYAAV